MPRPSSLTLRSPETTRPLTSPSFLFLLLKKKTDCLVDELVHILLDNVSISIFSSLEALGRLLYESKSWRSWPPLCPPPPPPFSRLFTLLESSPPLPPLQSRSLTSSPYLFLVPVPWLSRSRLSSSTLTSSPSATSSSTTGSSFDGCQEETPGHMRTRGLGTVGCRGRRSLDT